MFSLQDEDKTLNPGGHYKVLPTWTEELFGFSQLKNNYYVSME